MVKTLTYLIYPHQTTSLSTLPKSNVGLKVKIKRERHALKTADEFDWYCYSWTLPIHCLSKLKPVFSLTQQIIGYVQNREEEILAKPACRGIVPYTIL